MLLFCLIRVPFSGLQTGRKRKDGWGRVYVAGHSPEREANRVYWGGYGHGSMCLELACLRGVKHIVQPWICGSRLNCRR